MCALDNLSVRPVRVWLWVVVGCPLCCMSIAVCVYVRPSARAADGGQGGSDVSRGSARLRRSTTLTCAALREVTRQSDVHVCGRAHVALEMCKTQKVCMTNEIVFKLRICLICAALR